MAGRYGNIPPPLISPQTPTVITSINAKSTMVGVPLVQPAPILEGTKVTESVEAAQVVRDHTEIEREAGVLGTYGNG